MKLDYVGEELPVFDHATRWKAYLAAEIGPFLGAQVLEVGAGLGAVTRAFPVERAREWV